MRNLAKISSYILQYENIAIFSHVNTDMDAIGSSLALRDALISLGKKVDVYSDNVLPDNYDIMPDINVINKKTVQKYDLAIGLDSPNTSRFGIYEKIFLKIKNSVCIDHHMDNASYAVLNYVDKDESSTAAIIGMLIDEMRVKVNDKIAICLLCGIITDTAGFMYSNTSTKTLSYVARLCENSNIKIYEIMHNIYECNTVSYHNAYRIAMNNTKFYNNNKIAIITMRQSDYKSAGVNPENVYGLTDIGTKIKDVKITIVISEKKPEEYSISFRGRGVDVRVCAAMFGGGGHKYASGCRLYGNFESVYEKLLKCAMDEL